MKRSIKYNLELKQKHRQNTVKSQFPLKVFT